MITNINSMSALSGEVLSHQERDNIVSLDDLLQKSISENAVSFQQDKDDIMAKLQSLQTTTNPAKLFDLQQRTSDYNLQMSLFATLARKAVGAVETVIRA